MSVHQKTKGVTRLVKFGDSLCSDHIRMKTFWTTRVSWMKNAQYNNTKYTYKQKIFMAKPHCFRSILMLTAYRLAKLFNLASLHLCKCSVHDEIKKYEIDWHVARIREARCLHSILVCRSDENGGEGEEQNVRACTGLNWLRIGSCDEFSLIMW